MVNTPGNVPVTHILRKKPLHCLVDCPGSCKPKVPVLSERVRPRRHYRKTLAIETPTIKIPFQLKLVQCRTLEHFTRSNEYCDKEDQVIPRNTLCIFSSEPAQNSMWLP